MLQVNVSLRDGGVVFETFSKRAPDEAGWTPQTRCLGQLEPRRVHSWSQDVLHQRPRSGRAGRVETRRSPLGPQTRPNQKSQAGARNTPRPPQTREKGASGAERKMATTQQPIWGKRALVVWVGSWCSSGVRPFWSLFLGCWCSWSAFFLACVCALSCPVLAPVFSPYFLCMGAETLSVIPCLVSSLRIICLRTRARSTSY